MGQREIKRLRREVAFLRTEASEARAAAIRLEALKESADERLTAVLASLTASHHSGAAAARHGPYRLDLRDESAEEDGEPASLMACSAGESGGELKGFTYAPGTPSPCRQTGNGIVNSPGELGSSS